MNSPIEKIALCLPTYNEEMNIQKVVLDIRKVYSGFLFIVDGFSLDKTADIAAQINVPVYKRDFQGKGSAIQKALEIAELKGKEFLIYLDCDRTYNPLDLLRIIEDIDDFDLVVGVRPLEDIKPVHRRLGNKVVTGIINVVFKAKIKDSLSGFKCLRVSKFRNLLKENGVVIEPIICLYAVKYNMRIGLFPISYYKRVGQSKMNLIIGGIEFVKLIRIVLIEKYTSHKRR